LTPSRVLNGCRNVKEKNADSVLQAKAIIIDDSTRQDRLQRNLHPPGFTGMLSSEDAEDEAAEASLNVNNRIAQKRVLAKPHGPRQPTDTLRLLLVSVLQSPAILS
jgi:hypothetical protein